MDQSSIQEKFVTTTQGQIFYYLQKADTSKPTVVFLHGLSSNHTTWVPIMNQLRALGYNSLALDMRGHGRSDKTKRYSNYKLPIFSSDLQQVLDQEQAEQAILVGYSFGGTVALDFVTRFPQRVGGMLLISTNYVSPLKYRHLIILKPVVWLAYNLAALLLLWQRRREDIYFQHGQSNGYFHSFWIGLNTMPLSINFWMFIQAAFPNFSKTLAKIRVPTIILRASNDPFVTAREATDMQRMITGSRLIVSKNPSHFLASHAQDEITKIILDFIPTI